MQYTKAVLWLQPHIAQLKYKPANTAAAPAAKHPSCRSEPLDVLRWLEVDWVCLLSCVVVLAPHLDRLVRLTRHQPAAKQQQQQDSSSETTHSEPLLQLHVLDVRHITLFDSCWSDHCHSHTAGAGYRSPEHQPNPTMSLQNTLQCIANATPAVVTFTCCRSCQRPCHICPPRCPSCLAARCCPAAGTRCRCASPTSIGCRCHHRWQAHRPR